MSTQEATTKKTRVTKKASIQQEPINKEEFEDVKINNIQDNKDEVIKVKPKRNTQKVKQQADTIKETITESETCLNPILNLDENNSIIKVKPRRRKNVSMDDIKDNLKFNKEYNDLHDKIENITNVIKSLRIEVRGLRTSYMSDINLALKQKRIRLSTSSKTGFVKPRRLSDELCSLIGEPKGTEMSIPDYTKRFYEVLRTRNLFYENDKRVFRADAQLLKLFQLPSSVNDSTDFQDKNGFNFSTLQSILSKTIRRFSPETPSLAK